jgi:hypothetical protein
VVHEERLKRGAGFGYGYAELFGLSPPGPACMLRFDLLILQNKP